VCELAGVITNQADPRPIFSVTEAERAAARDAIATLDLAGNGPLVVLHPGAGTELKLWPPERWARTLDLVWERRDARTLIVSTRAEQAVGAAIQRAAQASHQHLYTDQGLGFLAAILEQADIVLGSDSGPLHLATAMGTATVRIYGPTDPAVFGPWPPADRQVVLRALVPCSPCGHIISPPCGARTDPLCLLEQSPESVAESVDWLLHKPLSVEAAAK
jgi:ADP-heptose:LPS heptosyltransferase